MLNSQFAFILGVLGIAMFLIGAIGAVGGSDIALVSCVVGFAFMSIVAIFS